MTFPAALDPPSKALWAAELPRAAWSVADLLRQRRALKHGPRGSGEPVLLLPGLFNSDRSNFVLRRYLIALGHDARGWGLGRNRGVRTIGAQGERLIATVAAIAAENGRPVALVGVSLGGIMARFVAHRRPDLVRQVVTISSPYAGDARATNVSRIRVDDRRTAERSGRGRPLSGNRPTVAHVRHRDLEPQRRTGQRNVMSRGG